MRLPAVIAAAILLTGCTATITPSLPADVPATTATPDVPAPTAGTPAVADAAGVRETLSALSSAFEAGDPAGVRPWLADPGSVFGRRWQARAENLGGVPLASYELSLDLSLPDLATDSVRERYDDPVQVVYVGESHTLEGFDSDGPAMADLFLTLVKREGRWLVAGDTDAEALGLISADHLWDHGPVETTSVDEVLALHHPGTSDVDALLAEAVRALEETGSRWPLSWSRRVPIIVPRDEAELEELLHVTFDLSNFVAFATATPRSGPGEYELTGSRIVLNPDSFLGRSSATRQRILVHEMIHVASRPVAGPMIPSWLDEGVAQALGERRSTTGTRLLGALAAAERDLPDDGEFVVGGRDRIFLSYQLAWSFVDHLGDRFGAEAVARFYAAVGEESVGEPGTESWHLDRAASEVFGAPLDDLVERWRATR